MSVSKSLIVFVGLVLAYLSGAAAMAAAFERVNPALAATSPIGNGPAKARLALHKLAATMSPSAGEQTQDFPDQVPEVAVELARQALTQEPLSDSAASLLALDTYSTKGAEAARPVFEAGYRLNRRNELVTLWLARDAALAGNVPETLKHFDELLRTSRETRGVLLGRFALATADRSFRREMAELMRTRPPWVEEFWAVAADVEGAAGPVGELRLLLADSKLRFQAADDRKLIDKLLNSGQFDLAEQIYRAETGPAGDAAGEFVRNAQFDRETTIPLVGWQTYSIGDFGSEIISREGLLLFSAITHPGGGVARQWISLPAGGYELSSRMKTIGRSKEDRVFAQLVCLTAPAGSQSIDIPLEEGQTKRRFSITGNCTQYWLDVVAAPAERSTGFDGELDFLSIRRAS